MNQQDTKIVCRDCEAQFVFTERDQKEFKAKGFNPPVRCPECHERRNSRRRYNKGGDVETHKATCSMCGNEAELPFKPTGTKPVYCSTCFQGQLSARTSVGRKEFVLRKPEKVRQEAQELVVDKAVIMDKPLIAKKTPTAVSTSFAEFNLDERLEKAILAAGYDIPTPVQSETIPIAIKGDDLIGTAQTGTGKTAAFVLPILHHLLTNPVKRPCTRAIVLTPTRELAEQIKDTFKQLGKFTKIRVATVYGGVGMNPQEHALRNGFDVIIACPGRILDHMERGNTNFTGVEKIVLDEADRMLDMGFLPPIRRILSNMPKKRQTMLFSATFAPELNKLAAETLDNPVRVAVDISAPAKTVAHALYPCPQHLKTSLVLRLLAETDTNSVLIFTRTKHRANRLAQQIEKAGYKTAAMHANKSQNQRQAALDDFKSGRCQVMVATDIAARGLDVESISHVINYDIPDTSDTYIHRIGRTGRAEREGDAMTLVTNQDNGIVWDIERTLGSPIERLKLQDFDYNAPAPKVDEFKRGPAEQRTRRKEVAPAKTPTRVRADGSPMEGKGPKKTGGYYASKRKFGNTRFDA